MLISARAIQAVGAAMIVSAIGVAALVAVTATNATVNGFDHAWWIQLAAGQLAATSLLALR